MASNIADSTISGKRQLVEHVIQDPALHASDALCNLLRYLAERSLDSSSPPLKEHQIATEVFGRPASFDPRLDSTVRVQTSRLGAKLADYYAGSGAEDLWQIEIPKGSYSVAFKERSIAAAPARGDFATPVPVPARNWSRWRLIVGAGLIVVSAVAVILVRHNIESARLRKDVGPDVKFWSAALPTAGTPLVIFSNAEFVGRPEIGLRYKRDSASEVFDQYTGVGEVIAIHELDTMFRRIGREFGLKRGELLNWDDTKGRDLIFVGSPSENLPARELAFNKDFQFQRPKGSDRPGDLGIAVSKPLPNEREIYFASQNLPIVDDYAVVVLGHEFGSAQHMLLIAGTTTYGTQGAVEMLCYRDRIKALVDRFGELPISDFSALLRITVKRGVPLGAEIVAFRKD